MDLVGRIGASQFSPLSTSSLSDCSTDRAAPSFLLFFDQINYKQPVPPRTDGYPTLTLDSIPVELFNSIASDLPQSDLFVCGVSSRVLELASMIIYPQNEAVLGKMAAVLFVNGRASCELLDASCALPLHADLDSFLLPQTCAPSSDRIRSLLLPSCVRLSAIGGYTWHELQAGLTRPSAHEPLEHIQINSICMHGEQANLLHHWGPILGKFDPKELQIDHGVRSARSQLPTVCVYEEGRLRFLRWWTRL